MSRRRVHPSNGRRGAASAPDAARPVLYLDIDDTILRYPEGRDAKPVPADGAVEFVGWALERYEVRWLTKWCRGGRMEGDLVESFCRMLDTDPSTVRGIRGIDWADSENKLDGIAWLEHLVLSRPFLWIEDEYGLGKAERRFLDEHGFAGSWIHCNVTTDPGALRSLFERMRGPITS